MIISINGKIKSGKDTVADIIMKHHPQFRVAKFADTLKEMTAILIGCDREQLEDEDFKNTPLGEEWDRVVVMHPETEQVLEVLPGDLPDEAIDNYLITIAPHLRHPVRWQREQLTPRRVLQLLGTEGMRNVIHPNVHVIATFNRISPDEDVIITDTRFPNEGDGSLQRGALLIRVVRPIGDRFPEQWAEFEEEQEDNFLLVDSMFLQWLSIHQNPEHRKLYKTLTHASETAMDTYGGFHTIVINNGSLEELETKIVTLLNQELYAHNG